MKKVLLGVFIFSFWLQNSFAQAGEWTWMHGDSVTNQPGNFGIQGLPSPSNIPPCLYEPCEWTDLNGNFWLYGGADGVSNQYADLWKYNPAANEWTWMKGPGTTGYPGNFGIMGVPSAVNNPDCRSHGIISWVDNQNNLWMFGGVQFSLGDYNNLWKYDIATNEWTWMQGPALPGQPSVYGTKGVPDISNRPSCRAETSASWTDGADDLWLFGGQGISMSTDFMNDLWRFNIASNTWTWMNGDSTYQLPVYGVRGVANSTNNPGSRWSYSHWKDNAGNFWLFGGNRDWLVTDYRNDMWRYSPFTNEWTWMGGDTIPNSPGTYGTLCTFASANVPRSRFENRACWTDPNGNLWMFGGMAVYLNDLWMYCVSTNQWAWINGDNSWSGTGSWGNLGVSSPSNKPDGRAGSAGWTDGNNHLYLFGGIGNPGRYNDLWKYTIDTSCTLCYSPVQALFTAANQICPGACVDFFNLSFSATSYQWNFPGATPDTSTATNPTNICYANPGSYYVQLIAANATGSDTLLLSNYITVYPSPAPQGISQSGDTLFANAGAATYQWYFNTTIINGATESFYLAPAMGDYNVVCTDANGCEVEAAVFNVIAASPTQPPQRGGVEIHPNPVGDMLVVTGSLLVGAPIEITIYNMLGEKVLAISPLSFGEGQGGEADVSVLTSAMYYLEVKSNNKIFRTKFVKQ